MKKKIWLALLLAVAMLALTACSDSKQAATPTEAPTAEPTEAPTAEPTEAPTAEPTEAPTPEPTEEPTPEPAEEADREEAHAVALSGVLGGTPVETAEEAEAVDEDPIIATAYNGEIALRASEVQDEYDSALQSYINLYAQYGYDMDEYDESFQESVAAETVQLRMSRLVVERYVAEQGYVLTEERDAELRAQAQETMDSMREYYESYLSYYGYAGEELESIVEEEIAASGYTFDTVYSSLALTDKLDFLSALATDDVSVTDEDVQAAFEEKVAQVQEDYANVDLFINDYLSGAEILYTPDGVRLIQCIYIAPELEAALLDEATPAEATPDEATPDEATPDEATPAEADPAELAGEAKALAVLARIRGGMDFTEAMNTYNEDGSTEEQLAAGYPIAESSTMYGDEFYSAAMALAAKGDISDVVVTNYGCFILHYADDLQSGTAPLEDRLEAETEEALQAKKDAAFSDYIDAMLDDAAIETDDLSPLFHTYTLVTIDATVAYATVSEETSLDDLPAGDAVATLSAGAALDVLGHIGMDGESYAFVGVIGTEYKGYIEESRLSAIDEETALSVDNTALVTAADVPEKLPVFTIVMNDGSIIYGELYPDVAPETVGNFISLATSGFYDGLTFHRVVPGFVIQGGDPNGDGTGGPGYAILGEFESNGVTNDLSHTRGVLSMARSSAANSGGSQFFIMHADNDYLDGEYAAFGMVLGGIETVDLIASTPTNSNDRPLTEQTMRTVHVQTYGQTYSFTKLDD